MKNIKKQPGEKGQGLAEYGFVVVLVAIALVALLFILGPTIGNMYSNINSTLDDPNGSVNGSMESNIKSTILYTDNEFHGMANIPIDENTQS